MILSTRRVSALLVSLGLFVTPIAQGFWVEHHHHHNHPRKVTKVVRRIPTSAPRPTITIRDESDSILGPCIFIVACTAVIGLACLAASKASHTHSSTTSYTPSTTTTTTIYPRPTISYTASPTYTSYVSSGYNECGCVGHCNCVEEETIIIDERIDPSQDYIEETTYIYS